MSRTVTLLSRTNCHLCEVAEEDVARICGELGVAWRTVDVDADPELRAEYGDMVPVILIDGKQHGYYRVEEERFRAALTG
ncbi:glutaredoxin family protein [Pseudonocardia kujensis]|uniref:glutaredoxin family protein n=1 Tax=Pseudonocardia kujensis TaxID=1128675 RepID=UPI001E283D3D|nr:glutaredoxin family protein [Pseudonocardia kujensis]MCE0768403.1 glutaredoxin family protein [Pseudonocardia kujensis]